MHTKELWRFPMSQKLRGTASHSQPLSGADERNGGGGCIQSIDAKTGIRLPVWMSRAPKGDGLVVSFGSSSHPKEPTQARVREHVTENLYLRSWGKGTWREEPE